MKPKKIIELLEMRRLRLIGPTIGFVCILLMQSLLIPLLPLPGKLILDRFQSPDSEVSDSFFSRLFSPFADMDTFNLLLACSLIIITMGLLLAVLRYGEGMIAALINRRIFANLRTILSETIISRRMEFLNQRKKVDLMGRVSSDVEKVQQVYSGAFSTLFKSIPTIILTVVAMLLTDPLVASLFLVSIPILYGATFSITGYLKKHNRLLRESSNTYQEALLQSYSYLPITKSLQSEKQVLAGLEASNQSFLNTFISSERVASFFYSTLIFVKSLIRALVLLVGCYFILENRISFGDFFLFFAYLEALIYPIDEISRFSTKWSKTQVSMDRIDHLLTEMAPYAEQSGSQSVEQPKLELSFKDVEFSYKQNGDKVLDRLNVNFTGPHLYAVVGASGKGKSTIFSLMNQLFTAQAGSVEFSGLKLADWDLKALRQQILLVDQASFLVSGSILDNLRLADESISEQQAWSALKKVNAFDFVQALPNQLDTLVGEGGQGLSGGQARRVSLARGFLKSSACVYLFDEPTAGLDPSSAKVVMDSLKEKSHDHLVLFSTHRMEELEHADSIFVLDHLGQPYFVKNAQELKVQQDRLNLVENSQP